MTGWDYISIGPTPSDEPCEQLGPNYDPTKARAECKRFIALIRKTLGEEPEGARLAIQSSAHDFGTYYEVVCKYEDGNEAAMEYAFKCESDAPTTWEG